MTTGYAGVVDHHVQATVTLNRGCDEPVDVVPSRDVRLEEEPPVADQRLGRGSTLARVAADVSDDDGRSLVREAQRDGASEP